MVKIIRLWVRGIKRIWLKFSKCAFEISLIDINCLLPYLVSFSFRYRNGLIPFGVWQKKSQEERQ